MTQTFATPVRAEPTPQQRRAMWHAIAQACFSAPGYMAYTNGLLLLYLVALGVDSGRIVFYLALPSVSQALLMVPTAYVADRVGKRKVGLTGVVLELIGLTVAALAPSLSDGSAEPIAVVGILAHAVGSTLYTSSWFALLYPIVPESMRGRFFGRLRLSWQLFSIVLVIACAFTLSETSPVWMFQLMIGGIVVLLAVRLINYVRIPELEHLRPTKGLLASVITIMRSGDFTSFCAYVFMLSLFTGACPVLFGLVEKHVLGWGDDRIMWMGNLYMIGSVVGFAVGGRMVDRLSTKPVFMVCHFGYGVIMFLFLLRAAPAGAILVVVSATNFALGAVWAASSIAISTEMLALIPAANKALSTSLCVALQRAGAALSSVLVYGTLSLGVLRDQWTIAGQWFSPYDTLLLGCGVMVVLMVVTLGLVPSVLRKAEWIPRQV